MRDVSEERVCDLHAGWCVRLRYLGPDLYAAVLVTGSAEACEFPVASAAELASRVREALRRSRSERAAGGSPARAKMVTPSA